MKKCKIVECAVGFIINLTNPLQTSLGLVQMILPFYWRIQNRAQTFLYRNLCDIR